METFSEKMLVLTDFSASAMSAARYAAALTHHLKTTNLILYHSNESIAMPPTTFVSFGVPVVAPAVEDLEDMLDLKNELEDLVWEQTAIEIKSDERTLTYAVNTIVQEQHIDLVVAGITGKSRLEKILIGSNTMSLAKDCIAPLLIVPASAIFQPIEKVVFACDLKRVSASTPYRVIKTFVHALGAKLLILNVDENDHHFHAGTIKEMRDLHKLWDSEEPEYHYSDHADSATGIMEFADRHQAQLVITIPKPYGFFESIFHRSITKKLAYHTHMPLLLFKEAL